MSDKNIYYKAEQELLEKIANEKHIFSFHTIVMLIKASCIANKL